MVLARDTLPLQRGLRRLVLGLVLGGLSLFALLAWVVSHVTRTGLRPLESLAREVTGVHPGTLSRRFQVSNVPAELRPVVEQLNQLLARLEAAFAREQRFAASAAHELLTPVAELRALAEAACK